VSSSFVLYVLVGKLLVYLLGQKFPYFINSKIEIVRKLFECDLCLGVWIYFFLAIGAQMRLFEDLFSYRVPLVGEFLMACVTSFVVHIFSIGWRERFSTVII
jgi:hypothetical protein